VLAHRLLRFVATILVDRCAQEVQSSMSDLPVVILIDDERGEVELAASRLQDTGLRNAMIRVRDLDDLVAWHAQHSGQIAFLIMHADTCRPLKQSEPSLRLPVYPAFAVRVAEGRLMASVWWAPGTAAIGPVPFDAPNLVRSLPRIGLHWLVV
jgi:hypothetical protein